MVKPPCANPQAVQKRFPMPNRRFSSHSFAEKTPEWVVRCDFSFILWLMFCIFNVFCLKNHNNQKEPIMKKIFTCICALMLCVGLVSCKKADGNAAAAAGTKHKIGILAPALPRSGNSARIWCGKSCILSARVSDTSPLRCLTPIRFYATLPNRLFQV